MIRVFFLFLAFLVAVPAQAQTFPQLTGRVVDQADLLNPEQEAQLSQRLEALETASSRQFVVATVSNLEGYEIEDYGYRLGRHWQIGQAQANNGVLLLVAPNEKKVRIEVGYGLEGVLTDALSSLIINRQILPRFRDGDFPGGIMAGADQIIAQLQAPPEEAEQRAIEAAANDGEDVDMGSLIPLIFWIIVLVFIFGSMLRRGFGGKRYRGRRRGGPIIIWGPGLGGWGGDSSGGSWGSSGGGFGGGGGFSGGFSGGGGSFGGGGASGGW